MAWPPEIRDRILAEAGRVFKKQVRSISGKPVPAAYLPTAVELKAIFVESGATTAAEPIKPFRDAIKQKNDPPKLYGNCISWCGIFTAWVYVKASVPGARWVLCDGLKALQMKKFSGYEGISAGDVAVIKGRKLKNGNDTNHHFIVADVPDSSRPDDRIWSVDGNTLYQFIRQIKKHRLRDIVNYYSFEGGAADSL